MNWLTDSLSWNKSQQDEDHEDREGLHLEGLTPQERWNHYLSGIRDPEEDFFQNPVVGPIPGLYSPQETKKGVYKVTGDKLGKNFIDHFQKLPFELKQKIFSDADVDRELSDKLYDDPRMGSLANRAGFGKPGKLSDLYYNQDELRPAYQNSKKYYHGPAWDRRFVDINNADSSHHTFPIHRVEDLKRQMIQRNDPFLTNRKPDADFIDGDYYHLASETPYQYQVYDTSNKLYPLVKTGGRRKKSTKKIKRKRTKKRTKRLTRKSRRT